MKVIISDSTHSYLMPGGKWTHAEKLLEQHRKNGISANFENWHTPSLEGEVVHFLGFNDVRRLETLKQRGYKLVLTQIMDSFSNSSKRYRFVQGAKNRLVDLLPSKFDMMFPMRRLDLFDALVYISERDKLSAKEVYGVDDAKCHVIPHGVDSFDFSAGDAIASIEKHEKYLVSVGSIIPRKNSALLARICREERIPIIFMGSQFSALSNYYNEFLQNVDGNYVKYLGFVDETIKSTVLKNASGFVLLSEAESGCIAVHEAAAYGLPLLLSDFPWAHEYCKPTHITHVSIANEQELRYRIREFLKESTRLLVPPFELLTWRDVSLRYIEVYESLL